MSLDRRMYEALRHGKGITLTADELSELVLGDDAIGTRISNAAALDAGKEQPGCDCVPQQDLPTWREFGLSVGF
jgi:hypothetical protein